MQYGLASALEEITLVLFTTLAPMGAFSVMVICFILFACKLKANQQKNLHKFLALPLLLTLVGLVASATHLGNPSNALYVLLGVGKSPLSNEVFSAVMFLGVVALYWLYSFSLKPVWVIQKACLVLGILLGVLFITAISFAYSVETIVTWNLASVPLSLWLNALFAGPLFVFATLYAAGEKTIIQGLRKWLLAISFTAFCASLVNLCWQYCELSGIQNALICAINLVPHYLIAVALYAVLGVCGLVLAFLSTCKNKTEKSNVSFFKNSTGMLLALSNTAAVLAIFIMRFTFYMMHMTAGMAF